jgi:hypothetical protein
MHFLRTLVVASGCYLWVVLVTQPEQWASTVPTEILIGTAVLYFVALGIAVFGYAVLGFMTIFFGHHAKKTLWVGVITSSLALSLALFVDADPARPALAFWPHATAFLIVWTIFFSLSGPISLGIVHLIEWMWLRRPGAKRLTISSQFA